MLMVKDMIGRIRSATHDVDEIGWNEDEILNVINAGYRFVARIIKIEKPELLAEPPVIGKIGAGEKMIELPKLADVLMEVIVDGKHLSPISSNCTEYVKSATGRPVAYALNGFKRIVLYPTPQEEMDYQIEYAADSGEQFSSIEDISPLPTDFDDAVMEYAVIRLSMANEFDMSQETTLMATIVNQIEELLQKYSIGNNHIIRGYWDGYMGINPNIHIDD